MRTIIENGKIFNEGRVSSASLIIDDDRIEQVVTGKEVPRGNYDNHVDATGCFVLLVSSTSTSISESLA